MYIQRRPNGTHLLRVTHKLIPKPKGQWYSTFDTYEEAHDYGTRLEYLLEAGIVPPELLLSEAKSQHDVPLLYLVHGFRDGNASISNADRDLARWVEPDIKAFRCSDVSFKWTQDFAKRMRVDRHLAPSTLRARVGFMGRAWSWYHAHHQTGIKDNPFYMLPEGYSVVTSEEEKAVLAKAGKSVKRDEERDRRLEEGEEDRIRRVLRGEKLRDDRERALAPDPEKEMMWDLHVGLGLRMRECYRLRRNSVDLEARLLHVDGTKGHRGQEKPRDVPLLSALHERLTGWLEQLPKEEWRLFPGTWDGQDDKRLLTNTTNRLSQQWARVFDHAGAPGLTEHDLRHEATCRWVLLKKADGTWALSQTQIAKILGWSSTDLFLRYASLRGSDLVDSLAGL